MNIIKKHLKNESGLSLVAVLWIVIILTVIATEFIYSVRLEQRIKDNMFERTKMYYAAKAGLEMFIAQLKEDETPYDALTEEWAEEITGEIEDGMRANNTLEYKVTVTDEGSKIHLNQVDENMLQGVLQLAGVADEEILQTLAQAIISARDDKPFRTVGELLRVENMTPELLYGTPEQQEAASEQTEEQKTDTDADEQPATPLINLITVNSLDKNVDADGQPRVNLNSADQNQLSGIQGPNQEQPISSGEAQAIIDQRDQQQYKNIGELFDAPAVSENMFNNIQDQISVGDEDDRVNINNASAGELQNLQGIDNGVAEDIVRYRNQQGSFNNVDDIRNAKVVNVDDMRILADKITTSDEQAIPGKINVNTAPAEILQLLPEMDENKAQAIIAYREVDTESGTNEQGGPFENLGQLLDVEGIDNNTFQQIVGLVTYRAYAFMVKSEGIARDNKSIASCTTIIDRTGNVIQKKLWQQQW